MAGLVSDSSIDRSICILIFSKDDEVLHQDPRRSVPRDQCPFSFLEQQDPIHVSTTNSPFLDNLKISGRMQTCSHSVPQRPIQKMAPVDTRISFRHINNPPGSNHRLSKRSYRLFNLEDISDPKLLKIEEGWSEEAIAMIFGSVKLTTWKDRSKVCSQFKDYLHHLHKSSFSEVDIGNFLARKFTRSGDQFCSAQTALSTTIYLNTGFDLSKEIHFSRQSKGASVLKPKSPKFDDMWDLSILMKHMNGVFWSDKPNISARTKANVLLRISIAGRNSDVAHIFQDSIVWTEDTVLFCFYEWKTKHVEKVKLSRPLIVKKLPNKFANICPFRALRVYVNLHCNDYQRMNSKGIWLDYNGTKEVKPSTLAKCTRDLMRDAGIDRIFGSVTIRHATITFWQNLGIPIGTVIERTGHKSIPLINKYYNKSSIQQDIFADVFERIRNDESSDEESEDVRELEQS